MYRLTTRAALSLFTTACLSLPSVRAEDRDYGSRPSWSAARSTSDSA